MAPFKALGRLVAIKTDSLRFSSPDTPSISGPLVNLDMPAMTMVFRVSDPAMLDQLKAGDKIKFEAIRH